MQNYMKTIIYAIKSWVNEKTKTATNEDVVNLLVEMDVVTPMVTLNNKIVTDSTGKKIYVL